MLVVYRYSWWETFWEIVTWAMKAQMGGALLRFDDLMRVHHGAVQCVGLSQAVVQRQALGLYRRS
jgi:hypothetical protein